MQITQVRNPPEPVHFAEFWSAMVGASLAILLGVTILLTAFNYFMDDSLLRGATRSKVAREGIIGLIILAAAVLSSLFVLWLSVDSLCRESVDHSAMLSIVLIVFDGFMLAVVTICYLAAMVTRVKDNVQSASNAGAGNADTSHGS